MVAAALDIQRDQVEAPGSWRTEKKIPYVVDNQIVQILRLLGGEAAENRIDSFRLKNRWSS